MTPDAIARHVAASVSKLEAERDARDFEELAAMGITPPLGPRQLLLPGTGIGTGRIGTPSSISARASSGRGLPVDGRFVLVAHMHRARLRGEAVADIGRCSSRYARAACAASVRPDAPGR
jgi:hypothetical protein